MSGNLVALEDLAVKRGGSVDPRKHPDEVFELFSIPAYDKGVAEVLPGREIGSSKKCVEPDDVLISRIVPHIRRSWIVTPTRRYRQIASGEWIHFRGNQFDSGYLRHFLISDPFHAQFMQTVSGVGGSLLRARPAEVFKFKIPLPPLSEQKRIAGILDAADALRAKRREALAQLDTLLQATFLDMFGDPVTNPKRWDTATIGNLVENIDSGWSPKCLERRPCDYEWGVLKLGAVTYCEYREWDTKALPNDLNPRPQLEVKKGDILLTRKNTYDLVAACAYVHATRPRLMLPDLIFRLRLKADLGTPAFVWQQLIVPRLRKRIQSFAGGSAGSMPNISKAKLRAIDLIVPPRRLQHRFASIVERVEFQKADFRSHLAELDTLFASLQARAFNGEL